MRGLRGSAIRGARVAALVLAFISLAPAGTARADGDIFRAVKDGDTGAVRAILKEDPAAARRLDKDSATPLHQAAFRGRDEAATMLLDGGADIRAKDSEGSTPLHVAALGCRRSTAALLIGRGAEMNARDKDGWTPLMAAAFGGCRDVVELLLGLGSDPRAHDYGSKSAAFWAMKAGHGEIASLLTERVNELEKDESARTPPPVPEGEGR